MFHLLMQTLKAYYIQSVGKNLTSSIGHRSLENVEHEDEGEEMVMVAEERTRLDVSRTWMLVRVHRKVFRGLRSVPPSQT